MSDKTMDEISHTHPHTGDTFGSVYRRGPVAADGGVDGAEDKSTVGNVEGPTMRDVDHTPTDGTVARIWDRGSDRATQNGANR